MSLNFADEQYVKLYRASSTDFLALSWQARGLFRLILTEVDRSGVLPLGKSGLKGVAVAVRATWNEIQAPLQELLDDGCMHLSSSGDIVIPNFVEAQEAKQSDAARQRKRRERASVSVERSVTPCDSTVTPCDDPVTPELQNVTSSHALSHGVTRCHDQIRSDQNRLEEIRLEGMQGEPEPLVLSPEAPKPIVPKKVNGHKAKPSKLAGPIPVDWTPSDANYRRGAELGQTKAWVDSEAAMFRDKSSADAWTTANWTAKFSYWLGNAAKWQAERGSGGGRATRVQPDTGQLWAKVAPRLTDEEFAVLDAKGELF